MPRPSRRCSVFLCAEPLKLNGGDKSRGCLGAACWQFEVVLALVLYLDLNRIAIHHAPIKDSKVRAIMKMIDQLQKGEAVPEAAFAALQADVSEGEEGEEEEEEQEEEDAECNPEEVPPKKNEKEEEKKGEDEGEEEESGVEEDATLPVVEVKPPPKVPSSISMPPPPAPVRKKRVREDAGSPFPEITPSPTSQGSGRSPEEVELAHTLYHVQKLEQELGVFLDLRSACSCIRP